MGAAWNFPLFVLLAASVGAQEACDAYVCEWGAETAFREDGLWLGSGSMVPNHAVYGKYLNLGSVYDEEKCCDICTSQSHDGVNFPLYSDSSHTTVATCESHHVRFYDAGQLSATAHSTQPSLPGWFCTFHTSTGLETYSQDVSENGFNSVRGCVGTSLSPSPPLAPILPLLPCASSTCVGHVTHARAQATCDATPVECQVHDEDVADPSASPFFLLSGVDDRCLSDPAVSSSECEEYKPSGFSGASASTGKPKACYLNNAAKCPLEFLRWPGLLRRVMQ